MAVQERISRIRFADGLGNSREWVATAASRDGAAGTSINVTVTITTTGAAPPQVADTLELRVADEAGTILRTISLTPGSASQTVAVFLTANAQSGGGNRAGTLELILRAVKTTGGPTATYNVESDGSPNTPPSTYTSTLDRGWIRSTTTVTQSISNAAIGGAKNLPFAYGDQMFQRAVLSAAPFRTESLTLSFGPLSGSASSSGTTFDRTHSGVVDTRFNAALESRVTAVSVPNSTFTGQPWTVLTSSTEDSANVDPRLTRTPLFQLDDNTFGTPPMSKHKSDHRRLTSQQGFLGSRTTNARGQGVNGVTYDVALTPDKPGTPIGQTGLVTATRGGEDGWSPSLLSWSSSLPGGRWIKSVAITSPTGYTGSYVVQNGSTEYSLTAPDPFLSTRVNVNHVAAHAGRHFEPGMPITAIAYLVDRSTQKMVPRSVQTGAKIYITRAHPNDDQGLNNSFDTFTPSGWVPWTAGTSQHGWAMNGSASDSGVWELQFQTDASWGLRDFRVAAQIEYDGVIYVADLVVVNVGPHNRHDKPSLGWLGLP